MLVALVVQGAYRGARLVATDHGAKAESPAASQMGPAVPSETKCQSDHRTDVERGVADLKLPDHP